MTRSHSGIPSQRNFSLRRRRSSKTLRRVEALVSRDRKMKYHPQNSCLMNMLRSCVFELALSIALHLIESIIQTKAVNGDGRQAAHMRRTLTARFEISGIQRTDVLFLRFTVCNAGLPLKRYVCSHDIYGTPCPRTATLQTRSLSFVTSTKNVKKELARPNFFLFIQVLRTLRSSLR